MTPNLLFDVAAEIWWATHKENLRNDRARQVYCSYLKNLKDFFRNVPLCQISILMIRGYQKHRAARTRKPGSNNASATNHEIECVLRPILIRANLWDPLDADYRRVPEPLWQPPKVMSEADETRLWSIAEANTDWELAFRVCAITANSTASGQELRLLQLVNIEMEHKDGPVFFVPDRAAKNTHRQRLITMNETAALHFCKLLERAKRLGSHLPEHFIFPYRRRNKSYDPTRPASASFLRNQLDALRIAADMQWITPHCFRHHAVTKMLEAGVPEQTVMAIAGHVSRKMLEHYSHTRIQAKRAGVSVLDRKPILKCS